jgi:hypothetical protein
MKIERTQTTVQQICYNSMSNLLNQVVRLYNRVEKLDAVEDISIELKPWNDGYRISVNIEWDYSNEIYKSTLKADHHVLQIANSYKEFHLQPCSFINDDIKTGNATLEGSYQDKGYKGWRSQKFDNLSNAGAEADNYTYNAKLAINEVIDVLDNYLKIQTS